MDISFGPVFDTDIAAIAAELKAVNPPKARAHTAAAKFPRTVIHH